MFPVPEMFNIFSTFNTFDPFRWRSLVALRGISRARGARERWFDGDAL
jgi:hypothetical protein